MTVFGDISCDIEGSIECTTQPTEPGNPVYFPRIVRQELRSHADGTALGQFTEIAREIKQDFPSK